MLDQALFALLHILVFVYWLGGDLGAFYTSHFLTRPGVSAHRRMMAATIVGDVDMAPRTMLILTLPTGLALAESKGWLSLGWPIIGAVFLVSLVWLAMAWKLHLAYGQGAAWIKSIDLIIRWVVLLGALATAALALAGTIALPVFIALKLILFAGCISLGLLIRVVAKPLGPALMGLSGDTSGAAEATVAKTLKIARPIVMTLWALLITAAFLGIWKPI